MHPNTIQLGLNNWHRMKLFKIHKQPLFILFLCKIPKGTQIVIPSIRSFLLMKITKKKYSNAKRQLGSNSTHKSGSQMFSFLIKVPKFQILQTLKILNGSQVVIPSINRAGQMSSFVGSNQFPISTAHLTPLTLFYREKFTSSGAEWKLKVPENKIFSCFKISNFPHLCMGKIIRSIIKIGGGRGDVMIQWRSKPPLMEYSEEARMMRLLAKVEPNL